jgi:hypothetical protein
VNSADLKQALGDALTLVMEKGIGWYEKHYTEWIFRDGHLTQGAPRDVRRPGVTTLPIEIETALARGIEAVAPGFLEMVYFMRNGTRPTVHSVLDKMVRHIWRRTGRLTNVDTEKENEITDFIELLETKRCSFLLVAPLQNVVGISTTSGIVEITPTLKIQRLSAEEIEDIWGTPLAFGINERPVEFAIVNEISLALEFGNRPAVYGTELEDGQDAIRALERCARIAKSGPAGCALIYTLPTAAPFRGSRFAGDDLGHTLPRKDVIFDQEDALSMQALWPRVQKGVHRDLASAIDRLNLAEIRKDSRDRVLDAAIGLECLLLHDGKPNPYRGELRYRFALNYAVMTDELSHRRNRFERARSIYDLRSLIAHSAPDKKILKECGDVDGFSAKANEACAMLRETIHFFLGSGWPTPDTFWLDRLLGSVTPPA